jgi:glutamate-5-semialdehyde dehydrogenase
MADIDELRELAGQGRRAALILQAVPGGVRETALMAMADALRRAVPEIIAANREDADAARTAVDSGQMRDALYKRLLVDADKIEGMAIGLESLAVLPDPVGVVQLRCELDEGLLLTRRSCPIGLLGVIFESRPDAVPQIMGLTVKSANAVVFKGGKEAARTNRAIFTVLYRAGIASGLPEGFAGLVETRRDVEALLALDDCFDLFIPRGSAEMVRHVMENTRVPVLGHADGVCTMFLERSADPDQAIRLALDAKVQYPAVCNAIENLLIDEPLAGTILPPLVAALREQGVEVRGDAAVSRVVPDVVVATDADWSIEYNDLVVSIAVVADTAAAAAFINRHGSRHTDAIVTCSAEAARLFSGTVDSSSVMVNASTRFADGFRYGFGAEVGVSTGKIHARGPVGLEGLLTYKYIVEGNGHLVADYCGPQARAFLHRRPVDG